MASPIRKEFIVVIVFILMALTIYFLESSRVLNNNDNNNNSKPSSNHPKHTNTPTNSPHNNNYNNTNTPTYSPTPTNNHNHNNNNNNNTHTPTHTSTPTPTLTEKKYYESEEYGRYNNLGKRSEFAYSFYITRDDYFCAALITAHQIRQWSQVDIVIHLVKGNYHEHIFDGFRNISNVYFRHVSDVLPPIGGQGSQWAQTWNKFWVFKLTEYRRVVHLDADTYVLKNLDNLFLLPEAELAMPRAYWIGSQPFGTSLLMVVTPSDELYNRIIDYGNKRNNPNHWDMDILNDMYRHSPHYIMLPGLYGLLHGEFASDQKHWLSDNIEETWEKAPLFHWSTWKPWNTNEKSNEVSAKGSLFKKTFTLWSDGKKAYCIPPPRK